ncbi:RICIN domain-containing protein [Massilia aquatica]|uniref:RICIN domain-containing protein n=1 Tax=Massilia aquatica TaxID=2609000 RepID=A0ABX0M997_9BURK|nr:RICIN domain-containing protein [Massilia aquatica]NHZ43745.1 RICIN domain-containing protein [Massilia aquatica]
MAFRLLYQPSKHSYIVRGGKMVDANANGRYSIVSSNSGKCVDVPAAGLEDGVNIQQCTCNGSNAQRFDVL